jgi:hypothetical protein
MIINAACTPDMTYYPFDKQSCTLTITPWNRGIDELRLEPLTNEWNTANMEKSSTWGVDSTSTETYIGPNNTRFYVDFKITIKRKPLFLALVIVLPVLLLSLLTGFLFLLPAASGSRVGFGITCFLSFVVLLQTLMSFMPEVSSPMSILCFYVIVMLSFSVFLSIINVFLLRLHLNPSKEEVPQYFHIILEVITCKVWRRCPKCPKIRCQCLRDLWHRLPTCSSIKCTKKHSQIDYEDSHLIDNDDMITLASEETVQGLHFTKVSETNDLRNRFNPEQGSGLIGIGNSVTKGLDKMHNANLDTNEIQPDQSNAFYDVSSILKVQGNPESDSQQIGFQQSNEKNGPTGLVSAPSSGYLSGNSSSKPSSSESGSSASAQEPRPSSDAESVCQSAAPSRVQSAASSASSSSPKKELTWEYIAEVLDLFFLAVFVIVQVIFTMIFLVPLGAQY